jgi:hypothetical protein
VIHADIKDAAVKHSPALTQVEQRVSKLEAQPRIRNHGVPVSPCFLGRSGCYQRADRPVAS